MVKVRVVEKVKIDKVDTQLSQQGVDTFMDEKQLDLVADNILDVCKVKVKSPTMLYDLRKYIMELEKDILAGKYSESK